MQASLYSFHSLSRSQVLMIVRNRVDWGEAAGWAPQGDPPSMSRLQPNSRRVPESAILSLGVGAICLGTMNSNDTPRGAPNWVNAIDTYPVRNIRD